MEFLNAWVGPIKRLVRPKFHLEFSPRSHFEELRTVRALTKTSIRLLVGLCVSLCVLLGGSFGTTAQTSTNSATPVASPTPEFVLPTFGIYPKDTGPGTPFRVTQKAGTSVKYTVVLVNAGAKKDGPFKGRTFVANATIRTNGGLNTGEPNETKTGASAWFDFPTNVLSIDPGKGIEQTFTVTLPQDAGPGEYIAALCFETADPLPIPGAPNLKQNLRKSIGFTIDVPGKSAPAFSIKDVRIITNDNWTGLEATIANTGNTPVKPTGTITVSDLSGKPLGSLNIELGSFFAFKNGLLQLSVGGLTPRGEYLVSIDLHDVTTGASATVQNQKVESTTSEQASVAAASPVLFGVATGELKPSSAKPQFLDVNATVSNAGDAVSGAELDIAAYKEGKLVETYVLVSPLALPKGDTTILSRYVPADGFSKGTWSFKLSVQVRDAKTGVATVLNTVSLGDLVNIP